MGVNSPGSPLAGLFSLPIPSELSTVYGQAMANFRRARATAS